MVEMMYLIQSKLNNFQYTFSLPLQFDGENTLKYIALFLSTLVEVNLISFAMAIWSLIDIL